MRLHRERGIFIRHGRGRHEAEQFYVRFCFHDAATADAFQGRFGDERMTYVPERARPRRPKRSGYAYKPRTFEGRS